MEIDKLLGENEFNEMVNVVSLKEGQKFGERVSKVGEDGAQSSMRNNMDQLDPKELKAQGSIGKVTP